VAPASRSLQHYLSSTAAGRTAQRKPLRSRKLLRPSPAPPCSNSPPCQRTVRSQRPGVPPGLRQRRHRARTGVAQRKQALPRGRPRGGASTVTRSSTPRLMNGPEARRAGRLRGAPPASRPDPGSAAASLRGALPCAASAARSSAAMTAVAAAPGASRRRGSARGAPSASSPAALVRRGCARRVRPIRAGLPLSGAACPGGASDVGRSRTMTSGGMSTGPGDEAGSPAGPRRVRPAPAATEPRPPQSSNRWLGQLRSASLRAAAVAKPCSCRKQARQSGRALSAALRVKCGCIGRRIVEPRSSLASMPSSALPLY